MNPPKSVEDPSLLQHEPLRTHVTMLGLGGHSRSATEKVICRFVDAMQQDDHWQAAEAAKIWACLVFDAPLDKNYFKVMDKGKELYRVFFKYQSLLHQGLQDGSVDRAREYQNHISRGSISAIKLKDHSASTNVQYSEAGLARFAVMKATCPELTESTGDIATSSSIGNGSHFAMSSSANGALPTTGARLLVSPVAAKPSKRSTSKKKKRKASSQKPSVITPSDASEEDEEPSKTRVVAVANSISHRQKRLTPNPCSPPHGVLEFKSQGDKKISAHGPTEMNKQHREDIVISQPQSAPTSFQSYEFVLFPGVPSVKGGRGAGPPPNGRKHKEARILKCSTQRTRAIHNSRGPRKTKSVGDLQTRATKRLCRESIPTLSGEPGEGSKSMHDLQAKDLQEPMLQGPHVTRPPSTREHVHVESKARRKRTRLESETGFVASHEEGLADSRELLGPDNIFKLRPLPQKVRDGRLRAAADEDAAARGVPCGAPSLEHADRLLRDVASNALAILQEGVGPDLPDWTQDEGYHAECDDLSEHDEEEANEVQVTTPTSAPPMVIPKPPVPAPPHVWAQSRQEVCESLQYFRCYHGGVYSKDDIVKGYLLGAYAASRDIFHHNGKLIISHGGGKSECILDQRGGPKRYQTDQDQEASDKSVRALLKTCKDRRPIALLADDKYALFPYDLTSANYTYVVLGFYWISHAWAECQPTRDGSGRIVRWKFVFQWCEGQGEPWWWTSQPEIADITSDPPKPISSSRMCPTKGSPHPANTGGDPSIQCKNCQEQSPFIYKQGWMCLNPRCNLFWSIDGEHLEQLDYREEFLSLLPQKFERLPNLTPARVVETPGGVTTTYAFSKGWHCAQCGRLSCRYKWEHWECPNCESKYVVNGRIRSPKEFWHQRPPKGFLHSQIGKDSGILASRLEPVNLGAHKGFTNCLTFTLPHDRGKIHLILGTPLSNGDADDIFQLYQQQASTGELKLRRYPLRNHKARGLLLTNYFSQNSGEPYQYVGGSGHTVPMCEAPDCVRRALALIKERSSLALSTDVSFNEVLSAAYMERQKMSFHSDSEKGLGPIVASLSLGSAALMHFRPHLNVDNPKSKSTCALTLVIRHGDVLVMEGNGVQTYYEHTVVPMNFRIAATARCIGSA